jgi:hypothetical protein
MWRLWEQNSEQSPLPRSSFFFRIKRSQVAPDTVCAKQDEPNKVDPPATASLGPSDKGQQQGSIDGEQYLYG